MIPRCPPYVARNHHSVVRAIADEPGDELVMVRRSDHWQDGWDARIYRGQGMDADPVLVAVSQRQPSPIEAFHEAVRRMHWEADDADAMAAGNFV